MFAYFVFEFKVKFYAPYYEEKIVSANLTKNLFEKIKMEKIKRGIIIDPINDPNQTGLIGIEYSPITSEPGDLNAKLTTTNPNIAGVVVELLKKCNLEQGDLVAVSFSGSFPALNIAVLAACQTLNLKPIIITSLSSSVWGANIAEFTYLDMENLLYQNNLLKFHTVVGSVGGIDDIGRGLSPEGRNLLEKAIKRNGVQILTAKNLEEAIENRFALYNEYAKDDRIACFINVGGGAAALAGFDLPTGIVNPAQYSFHQGLVGKFLRAGVKVINLDNINYLARRYDLPIAPIPIPPVGEGKLYYENRYSVPIATIFFVILTLIIFIVLRFDIDFYIRGQKND